MYSCQVGVLCLGAFVSGGFAVPHPTRLAPGGKDFWGVPAVGVLWQNPPGRRGQPAPYEKHVPFAQATELYRTG